MRIEKIPVGKNPPWDLNIIIEIPLGGAPMKYEFDKTWETLVLDREIHTPMFYPCNYGFVPHTLSEDGDPIDILVAGRQPVIPGCVMRARPIGVLLMEDEKGLDEKILCVPVDELSPYYKNVHTYRDLPEILIEQIGHFFKHYKELEPNKWVKIIRWGEPAEAAKLIEASMGRWSADAASHRPSPQ